MAGDEQYQTLLSDIELMLAARDDSAEAFETLYRRYYGKVQHFFCAMGRCPALAEDLCHETFLRIWKLRKRYAATGSFPAYLFTFARMIWFERCRERKRISLIQSAQTQRAEECDWTSPGTLLDQAALGERLSSAIDALPEDQKMAFVLRVVDGLPLEDIAKVLQCPVNTVRSRKLLAVRKLRGLLEDAFAAFKD